MKNEMHEAKSANELTRYSPYRKFFNKQALWKKLQTVAKKAGVKTVYAVLLLYYVATHPDTPIKEKAKIYGALGYFILPLDLIPDAAPIIGFTDDMTALTIALKAIWNNITPAIHDRAYERLSLWFKDVNREDLNLF